jgi:hypothetical protein
MTPARVAPLLPPPREPARLHGSRHDWGIAYRLLRTYAEKRQHTCPRAAVTAGGAATEVKSDAS